MKIQVHCISDVGCLRSGNEDMAGVGFHLVRDGEVSAARDTQDGEPFHIVIADGMGGHDCGEVASRTALEELRFTLYDGSREWLRPEEEIAAEAGRIGAELNRMSVETGLVKDMGCTLCGLIWLHGRIYMVNVGDSRLYRLRDGLLRQLSSDQTLMERDRVPLPEGKALYSCLGGGCLPETVVEDISDRLLGGDRVLVCSDGLTDMVAEEDIERMLGAGTPAQAAGFLVEAARLAGGADNITVAVADITID